MLEMISNYDLKNAIIQYTRNAEEYETISKLWEDVARNYKKDGSDFSTMSKNFSGCTFKDPTVCKLHALEKEITVCGPTPAGRYVHAKIDNYQCVKYSKIKPEENRIIKESFLEPYFYLTAGEIEQAIKEESAKYKAWAENNRKRAKMVTAAAELYNKKMQELNQELKNNDFPFDAYDIQRFGK